MKLAAVVILYYPNRETITNIASYYDYFDKVFVFDNTDARPDLEQELSNYEKIAYHHDYRNCGIAERLNAAAHLAMQEGFTWLFTLDQDTHFSLETLSKYLHQFYEFADKTTVAMFGIEHEGYKLQSNNISLFSEVDTLITSGTLLNLALFDTIGPFDEELFIDLVDIDYCIRAKKAGCRIIKFHDILFSHAIGKTVNRSSIKTLFLLRKQKEVHSALRCYYMYRNLLYIEEKHKNYDRLLMKQYRECAIARVWNCLYYARDSWNILKHLIRAKSDFVKNKMGKLET